ncbi:MAG: CDP-alcohol phosphatidyltransferase family protein [Spirochaetales bacterium]|nr:CDP-alcohol phosphatidyltransferase family protein [Spirochaetales bacterium]
MNHFMNEYRKTLKEADAFLDLYIYRPLAFPIVLLGRKLKLTPSQITTVSLLCMFASGWFFLKGQGFLGGLFLFLGHYFDCADGQLARLTQQFSQKGANYDMAADSIGTIALFVGIIYHQYQVNHDISIFILGPLSIILSALNIILYDNLRARYLRKIHPESVQDNVPEKKKIKSSRRIIDLFSFFHEIIGKVIGRLSPLPDFPAGDALRKKYKKWFGVSLNLWSLTVGVAHINTAIILAILNRIDLLWDFCIIYFPLFAAVLVIYQNVITGLLWKKVTSAFPNVKKREGI